MSMLPIVCYATKFCTGAEREYFTNVYTAATSWNSYTANLNKVLPHGFRVSTALYGDNKCLSLSDACVADSQNADSVQVGSDVHVIF